MKEVTCKKIDGSSQRAGREGEEGSFYPFCPTDAPCLP